MHPAEGGPKAYSLQLKFPLSMNWENQKQMCEEELICSLINSFLNMYAMPLQSGKFCILWVKFTTIQTKCLTKSEGSRIENMWKNENRHLCQFPFPYPGSSQGSSRNGWLVSQFPARLQAPRPIPNNTYREPFMQMSNKITHFPQDIETLVLNDRRWNPYKLPNPHFSSCPVTVQNPTSLQAL